MQGVLERISKLKSEEITYENVGNLLRELDLLNVEYESYLPDDISETGYTRVKLLSDPIEVTLLIWPGGAQSAIHEHNGFWGYVCVLDGCCDNTEYLLEENKLLESRTVRAFKGGILEERDGVVHTLGNPNNTERSVTVNIYYPPLESFSGMRIFNSETNQTGTLNEKATGASWSQPEENFERIENDAFEFIPYSVQKPNASHRIFPILPKPGKAEIAEMIGDYYTEQATTYDQFDLKHPSRNAYTDRINSLIAKDLDEVVDLNSVLTLACGTGRRALDIREKSSGDYKIVGVDLSKEMCFIAKERGIEASHGDWNSITLPVSPQYDAATFLYAYGHLANIREREEALQRINSQLKMGGKLFIDVFNIDDKLEWGPSALSTYHELSLESASYDPGDVFYKKAEGNSVAFIHYFNREEISSLLEDAGFMVEKIHNIGYVKRAGEILEEGAGSLFIVAVKTTEVSYG